MSLVPDTVQAAYGCPDWCERKDHWADEPGPGFPAVHYGPSFGSVEPHSDGFTFAAHLLLGDEGALVSNTAELRQVAADLLRAAEWIEATQ